MRSVLRDFPGLRRAAFFPQRAQYFARIFGRAGNRAFRSNSAAPCGPIRLTPYCGIFGAHAMLHCSLNTLTDSRESPGGGLAVFPLQSLARLQTGTFSRRNRRYFFVMLNLRKLFQKLKFWNSLKLLLPTGF
jgi:hypothetical protein